MKPTSLAERSLSSTAWQLAASLANAVVLLARSILLARLLPVNAFGVFAYATSLVNFTLVFASFGLGEAFIHRAEETLDEDRAAAVHFTLNSLFTLLWATVISLISLALLAEPQRTALVVVVLASAGIQLTQTPQLLLTRRVDHRRLALVQFLNAPVTTLVSVLLAWQGFSLWALLAAPLSTMLLYQIVFFVWKPVWRPRLAWAPGIVRYYLRFGVRQLSSSALQRALDEVDDLWTGTFLGQMALGFYSRAYTFATYPRKLLAHPVSSVAVGVYAELKGKQPELSSAFFYINALLVRSGFLLAGALALAAPEFIRLLIGERWMPMLPAFRLMLVFALLDPVLYSAEGLFVAVGRPALLTRIRLIQLIILVGGMSLLGHRLGITGVALAVDLMLLVGLGLTLLQARRFVEFSNFRLFAAPLLALNAGLAGAWLFISAIPPGGPDLQTALVKLGVFSMLFASSIWLLERRELGEMLRRIRPILVRLSPACREDSRV